MRHGFLFLCLCFSFAFCQSSEEGGAVTYIVFAERTPSPDFIYLAVGRKDGVVSTYKCFRTALEVGMMGSHGGFHSSTGLESPVLSHEPPALLESDSPHVDVRRASDLVEEVDKVQLCWKQASAGEGDV